MIKHTLTVILLAAVAVGLTACDSYTQDDYEPEYIVEAYLVAGEALPTLRLSRTAPIGTRYRFEDFAVDDAEVAISLLGADDAVEERYAYRRVAPGVYGPEAAEPDSVRTLRTYALAVQVPDDGAVLRAQTFVPGPFQLLDANADTLVYQAAEQLEARVTLSSYPGRQNIYVFTLQAQDTTNYDLTPFYADQVDDDEALERADLVENSSGIANEENFEHNDDGTLTLRLPWVAVAFYGPNNIIANAIDDNLYDFLRSQGSGGTGSPGDLQNLIDHVDGGRGVFGSMARDQVTVFVQSADAP